MRVAAVVLAAGKGERMRSATPKVLHRVAGRPMIARVLDAVAGIPAAAAGSVDPESPTDPLTDHSGRRLVAIGKSTATGPVDDENVSSSPAGSPDATRGATPVRAVAAADVELSALVVVVGAERKAIEAEVHRHPLGELALIAVQDPPRGTGDAALHAASALEGRSETTLILCGDTPLLTPGSLARLLVEHTRAGAGLSLLTADIDEPGAYGRVVRDGRGRPTAIVEASDAGAEQRSIREINTGVYAARSAWLWPALRELRPSAGGEVYLTDLVAVAAASGVRIAALPAAAADEFVGVNTRSALAWAERAARERERVRHMARGVTLIDPGSTWIDSGVEIGRDTEVWPGSYLLGRTVIGEGCRIGPGSVLRDATLEDGATVELSLVDDSLVGAGSDVGPFAHLRGGTRLASGVHVGSHAELKNCRVGAGTRMGHFGYMGDANIGERVNIGAGAVTCNFDGRDKHATEIATGAFIGSDTMLVAPLKVGEGALTGAGSVVTGDVAAGERVVGAPARPIGRSRSEDTGADAGSGEGPVAEWAARHERDAAAPAGEDVVE